MNGYPGIDIFSDRLHIPSAQQRYPLKIEANELEVIVFPAKALDLLVRRDPVINQELPHLRAVDLSGEQGGRTCKPLQRLPELRVATGEDDQFRLKILLRRILYVEIDNGSVCQYQMMQQRMLTK